MWMLICLASLTFKTGGFMPTGRLWLGCFSLESPQNLLYSPRWRWPWDGTDRSVRIFNLRNIWFVKHQALTKWLVVFTGNSILLPSCPATQWYTYSPVMHWALWAPSAPLPGAPVPSCPSHGLTLRSALISCTSFCICEYIQYLDLFRFFFAFIRWWVQRVSCMQQRWPFLMPTTWLKDWKTNTKFFSGALKVSCEVVCCPHVVQNLFMSIMWNTRDDVLRNVNGDQCCLVSNFL